MDLQLIITTVSQSQINGFHWSICSSGQTLPRQDELRTAHYTPQSLLMEKMKDGVISYPHTSLYIVFGKFIGQLAKKLFQG